MPVRSKQRGFSSFTMCALCIALSACETTGDPREGGLLHWSQKKANERQRELEQEDANAKTRVSSEQRRHQELQGKQMGLSVEAMRLQAEVDRLLSENAQLESQLADLMDKRQLGDQELQRLTAVLKENERLRQSLKAPLGTGAGSGGDTRADAVNTQNQKLHREILALLGR